MGVLQNQNFPGVILKSSILKKNRDVHKLCETILVRAHQLSNIHPQLSPDQSIIVTDSVTLGSFFRVKTHFFQSEGKKPNPVFYI